MHYVMMEPELADLGREIAEHHPDLTVVLQTLADKDIYMQIAAIAVHCNMILHGDYTKEDMLGIAKKLTEKLVKKRTIHLDSGIVGKQASAIIVDELDMSAVQNLPDASGTDGKVH